MNPSILVGVMFASAGMGLFLAQVTAVELARAYKALQACVEHSFGHDAAVFPDHQP